MIRLENVCKNFGDLQVLKNVNLEVKEGEKLVIIGPPPALGNPPPCDA